MTAPKQAPTRITFGAFEVDAVAGELRKSGFRIHLPPQPFQLLLTLLDRPGEIVTRDELQQQLWGHDTFVDFEHGLNAAVKKLRQALGDSADSPRFIETLPGRGYRFLASVERIPVESSRARLASMLPPAETRSGARAPWVFGALLVLGCLGSYWLGARRLVVEPGDAIQFRISAPQGHLLQPTWVREGFALSPDGSRLAFTALNPQNRLTLWRQDLAELDPRPVPRTEGAYSVSWTADSRSLFFTTGTELRRIPLDGDTPLLVCSLPPRMLSAQPLLSGDVLLSGASGTFLVPAAGGPPELLTEGMNRWPQVLPGGKHLLSIRYDKQADQYRLIALDQDFRAADDEQRGREILETDSRVVYAASPSQRGSGHLFYLRSGNLVAQPFDAEALRVTGTPTPIASDIFFFRTSGAADFSVSNNGVLAYQPFTWSAQLAWVDREGREVSTVGPRNAVVKYARLSPDGRKIVASLYTLERGASQLWTFDTASGAARQVTDLPGYLDSPVWSPDSQRLSYGRTSGEPPFLYAKGLNENDVEEALPRDRHQFPSDWSPDGRFIAFSALQYANTEAESNSDVRLIDFAGEAKLVPLLQSSFHETGAVFSPDGKWLAFVTTESGKPEIYVQAFEARDAPRLHGERVQVSHGGAYVVRWRRDGKELYYLGADLRIHAVPVTLTPSFRAGTPAALFSVSRESLLGTALPFGFDASPDGSRFLVPLVRDFTNPSIVVVKNWEALLRRHTQ